MRPSVPVALALAIVVSACSAAPSTSVSPSVAPPSASASLDEGPSGEPVRIGIAFATTGPAAFVAEMGVQGAELAAAELNAGGGILGRPVELVQQDTQCEPTEAVSAIRQLIEVQGIRVILGATCSSETLAAMPVVEELEAVLMNTMSTAPAITEQAGAGGNPWIFRINPPDSAFAPALAELMAKKQGDVRVAIVAVNNDLGRGAADAFTGELEARDAAVTSTDFYDQEGPYDFSSVLTKVRGSDAQAIIFVGTIEAGVPFMRQYDELGLTQRVYSRGLSLTQQLFDDLGQQADGLFSTEPYYSEIDTPENAEFVAAFRAMHGSDPVYQAYTTYQATKVLAQAIEAAGAEDPTAVRDALAEVTQESITGTVDFDDHNQAHTRVFLARVTCDPECRVEIIDSVETGGEG